MMNTEPELNAQDRIRLAVAEPPDCAAPVTSEPSFAKWSSPNPVMRRRLRVSSSTRAPESLRLASPLSQTPGVFGNADCAKAISVNKNSPANAPAAINTLRPAINSNFVIPHFSCSIYLPSVIDCLALVRGRGGDPQRVLQSTARPQAPNQYRD